jgi:molybdopterin molybdotransferase
MITVEEAENIIREQVGDYGVEIIPFELALGRILAEDIQADRDFPPFNRVTMDGIAVNFNAINEGTSAFRIKKAQAAGDIPVEIEENDQCIEIMTGAALPASTDTVIRYEDLSFDSGVATLIHQDIKRGQNIHYKGKDKQQGDIIAKAGGLITPSLISLITSVGEAEVRVRKIPRIVILSSGDELIDVNEEPSPYQLRRSNDYTLQAILKQHHVDADISHLPDDLEVIKTKVKHCIEKYDAVILSGGISMGKFDYIPIALEELNVDKLFHKVQQRPGKPFWFGKHPGGSLVFAFPGNPVASFMCMHRYFLPWLKLSLGGIATKPIYAVLNNELSFDPPLKYFLQVELSYNDQFQLTATPVEGNGSGDFANLSGIDAFMELPSNRNEFKKGEAFRIWPF